VTEGPRYVVGTFDVTGSTVVTGAQLRTVFPVKVGKTYSHQALVKGMERVRELYGALGYWEFTAMPEMKPRPPVQAPAAVSAGQKTRRAAPPPPIVDVTLKVDEGKRYFINRITFVGNVRTRDEVLRRQLNILEDGVFNTEALKISVRRLNQLGYFKTLENESVDVQKTPGETGKVDISVKLEEQNRNQVTFGAGASETYGMFVSASYATSNFLGRGETVSLSGQKGARSNYYQVGVTEPYAFGHDLSTGITLFSRKLDYQIASDRVDYSQTGAGATFTVGVPLKRFLRGALSYGYEAVKTASSDVLKTQLETGTAVGNQFIFDGNYRESSITPALIYNTIDNPLTPRRGLSVSTTYQYAGGILGGTVSFIKPEGQVIYYYPVRRRMALGLRASGGWVRNAGAHALPYYLRYALGGETQIRGVEIRTVGPINASGVVLGGTKYALFNAEYYYDIAPMVRALVFHDAGQAFDEAHAIDFRELRTSSGVEVRVTLPVIGVPFRLIYAWNVYRDAFQPARTFKFAVGTTF
jgi:outer membrane protein insertion porin family